MLEGMGFLEFELADLQLWSSSNIIQTHIDPIYNGLTLE